MKIIISGVIILLFFTTISFSQWYPQNSNTTVNLTDIAFVDTLTGWVVGNNGTILKTTNAGNDWIAQTSSTFYNLRSVSFANSITGWAVGDSLLVIKTTNGGSNWFTQSVTTPFTFNLESVFFTDLNTGWLVGNNQYSPTGYDAFLFKTTDGGSSWDFNYGVMDKQLYSMMFINSNLGWASGNIIIKTTDGGISWDYTLASRDKQFDPVYCSIFFINNNIGWVAGKKLIDFNQYVGEILKTSDGGDNWTTVYTDSTQIVSSIYFVTENIGWCTGTSANILYTTNGGIDWAEQITGINSSLNSIFFQTDNLGWAVGSGGKILFTLNAGTPVELTSFTAQTAFDKVVLSWSTATEINNQGFEIERQVGSLPDGKAGRLSATGGSAGNSVWERIGFVPGYGTTTEPKSYSFTDSEVSTGKYIYRLKQIDFDGSFEYSQEVEVELNIPLEFELEQNYPNPFNPGTVIRYQLPVNGDVLIKVFDVLGNEIATLVDEYKPAGRYEIEFNVVTLPSGVYFYQLLVSALQSKDGKAGSYSEIKKMVLMK